MTNDSLNRITELARQIIDNAESMSESRQFIRDAMGDASTRKDEECIRTAGISKPVSKADGTSPASDSNRSRSSVGLEHGASISSVAGSSPAVTAIPSEISVDAETLSDVVDEYLHWRKVNPHIKGGENYLKRLRAATRKPVSVSLEKCAAAVADIQACGSCGNAPPHCSACIQEAKAVLDAAGVKYHD